MIAYNPKEWFGLIFYFHKSDTFRRLIPLIVAVSIYSAIIAYIEIDIFNLRFRSTAALHSILGFVISILLVFRTNTAYDRWWEGRKLWGQLVNNSRSFALKVKSSNFNIESKNQILQLIGTYPNVLKMHLRNEKHHDFPKEIHQPNYLSMKMHESIQTLRNNGELNDQSILFLNNELVAYSDICGACERIKNTPIPIAYSMFLKKFIFIYILTMPYGFINEFGYGVIAVVAFTCYVLTSMELIAEDIENPFGYDANDLPTDGIANTIEKNISEIKGF
ncbi:MAG: bestrophin family protein [Bacteroidia bacterium]